MNQENIKKRHDKPKTTMITIRVTKEMSAWIKEKDYSPSGIFFEAVKDLGFKGKV